MIARVKHHAIHIPFSLTTACRLPTYPRMVGGAAKDVTVDTAFSAIAKTAAAECAITSSCAYYNKRGDDGLIEKCLQIVDAKFRFTFHKLNEVLTGCISECMKLVKEKCKNNPNACPVQGSENEAPA